MIDYYFRGKRRIYWLLLMCNVFFCFMRFFLLLIISICVCSFFFKRRFIFGAKLAILYKSYIKQSFFWCFMIRLKKKKKIYQNVFCFFFFFLFYSVSFNFSLKRYQIDCLSSENRVQSYNNQCFFFFFISTVNKILKQWKK